jgi:hypothetical protein
VLLALFYLGARRLEHLRYLGGDPLVTRFCGLARLPTRRTVADWLRQFTQETLAPLIALNRDLVTEALARLELPRLTIDVDGSVIRTGATVGWAFRGFNPHHRKDPSYYPLVTHVAQTGQILRLKNLSRLETSLVLASVLATLGADVWTFRQHDWPTGIRTHPTTDREGATLSLLERALPSGGIRERARRGRARPRSGDALVAVMEPADLGNGVDPAV